MVAPASAVEDVPEGVDEVVADVADGVVADVVEVFVVDVVDADTVVADSLDDEVGALDELPVDMPGELDEALDRVDELRPVDELAPVREVPSEDERIVVDELPLVSDSVVRPLDSELARLSDSRLVADVDRPVVEAEEVVDVA